MDGDRLRDGCVRVPTGAASESLPSAHSLHSNDPFAPLRAGYEPIRSSSSRSERSEEAYGKLHEGTQCGHREGTSPPQRSYFKN